MSMNALRLSTSTDILLLAARNPAKAFRAGEPVGPRSVSDAGRHKVSSTHIISGPDISASKRPKRVAVGGCFGADVLTSGSFTSRIVGLEIVGGPEIVGGLEIGAAMIFAPETAFGLGPDNDFA